MDAKWEQAVRSPSLVEIGEELGRRLRAMHEEKWPGRAEPMVEVVKTSVNVYYGPPGHRITMTRAEALRFLEITATAAAEQGGAAMEADEIDGSSALPVELAAGSRKMPNLSDEERERRRQRMLNYWRQKRGESSDA